MRDDCRPQLFDALLACRDRRDDRWLPHPFGREVHHRPQLGRHPGMAVEVGFVDNEDVGDLEDAGLDHLHAVAEVRGQDDDGGVGDGGHLELGLTHADRFQDHLVEAECSQQPDRLTRRQGQPAEVTPRTHAANEDLSVQRMALHADAVTENGPARERRVGVGGEHRDGFLFAPKVGHHRVDQRRFSSARRAGETGHARRAGVAAQRFFEVAHRGVTPLDQSDGSREGTHVAGSKPG